MAGRIVWLGLRYEPREILGIFETDGEAVAACETDQDVIGPVEVGVVLPDGEWEGAYYPVIGRGLGDGGRETSEADSAEEVAGESGEAGAE